jgi:hypothetical protein
MVWATEGFGPIVAREIINIQKPKAAGRRHPDYF